MSIPKAPPSTQQPVRASEHADKGSWSGTAAGLVLFLDLVLQLAARKPSFVSPKHRLQSLSKCIDLSWREMVQW